jgi:hypothetical protein
MALSGIVPSKFGWTEISQEYLQEVNEYRENKEYSADVVAPMTKRGTVKKQPLQSSPFVVKFEYGANVEGY